jgi:hypothetical protein
MNPKKNTVAKNCTAADFEILIIFSILDERRKALRDLKNR